MSFRSEVITTIRALPEAVSPNQVAAGRPTLEGDYPHFQLQWDVSRVPALQGDAATLWDRSAFAVEVWEKTSVEDGSVARKVAFALDRAKLAGLRVSWTDSQRIEDPDGFDLVHTVVSFSTNAPFAV